MSAAALLTELSDAGITLTRNGDRLHYQTRPGVTIGPYRAHIREAKPELLAALREREVLAALADQLEAGWNWLASHPDHPEHDAFLERWAEKLHRYERTSCGAVDPGQSDPFVGRGPVSPSVHPEGWAGIAPAGCGAPIACGPLGPCRQFTDHGRCWTEEA
jgi:hypothetical protein